MKKKAAFTFVEMLVVVTIFSILSVAVYATFASGMRMWGRVQDAALSQRKAALRLEKMSSDLRQILYFPQIGFAGKSNEVSFPSLSANNELVKVTYFFEQNNLLRKQELYKDILEEKKEEVKAKSLLTEVEDLKFEFAYKEIDKEEYSWKDEWNKEDGLPIMVKIELKTQNTDLAKTITIPIS